MSKEYYESAKYEESSLTGNGENFIARIMHELIERPHQKSSFFESVLEVGADQGQHLKYVKHKFQSYKTIDLHLPKKKSSDSRVTHLQGDVHNLPFKDNIFDRVIVTCVFHHLQDPNKALSELVRVVKENGVISVLIPRDPSTIYNLVRNSMVFCKFRSLTLLKESKQRHKQEHIWNFKDLMKILRSGDSIYIQTELRYPHGPFYVIKVIELKKNS
jgi:ubiquinone/menaquinone biosynthesis C-methylase UbiE